MEEQVKHNQISLTTFRGDKNTEDGLTLHEFGRLVLTSNDVNMFDKLMSFCHENNIQMDILIERRTICKGQQVVKDITPNETISLEEFFKKFNIK